MHKLSMKNFGPIKSCELEVNELVLLTGAQASGKSTVAKTIYFFKTVKDDILNLMLLSSDENNQRTKWKMRLSRTLRLKFLQLFGSSHPMSENLRLIYKYAEKTAIEVTLIFDRYTNRKDFIEIKYSEDIENYLSDLDQKGFENISDRQLAYEKETLNDLFDDEKTSIFVPAGRSMITLLTSQLNYIFVSMEDSQRRNIDYCTQRYIELILKLKPLFSEGLKEMVNKKRNTSGDKLSSGLLTRMQEIIRTVLKGNYRYSDGEERLYFEGSRYVKINYTSSGQQEIVWMLNLLFYYVLENKKVFLILEEPESHLYPDAQKSISELIALFKNYGNDVLLTTHSPYMLGAFNNLLLSHQVGSPSKEDCEAVKKIVDRRAWIDPKELSAYHTESGKIKSALDEEAALIDNALIDGISNVINEDSDALLNISFRKEAQGE